MDFKNRSVYTDSPHQQAIPLKCCKKTVYLTLTVPPGKRRDMCRILKPVVRDVHGLATFLDVRESTDSAEQQGASLCSCVPKYTVSSQELSAPALAVIVLLPESSKTTTEAATVRQKLLKFPWRYHHAIQLQSATDSSSVIGQHDFYFLSRQLPLWSVCARIDKTEAVVRFNLFVRRFAAMVEFYRLITNSEMESKKPGFCLFPLGQGNFGVASDSINITTPDNKNSNGSGYTALNCELVLKHCPLVNPYPLTDAYLSFPVQNMQSILSLFPTQTRSLSNHRYLLHDPDGNAIVIFDPNPRDEAAIVPVIPKIIGASRAKQLQTQFSTDKSSEHACSIDSGRYSDFETSSFELENCMSKLVKEFDFLRTETNSSGGCDSSVHSQDTVIRPTNLNDPSPSQCKRKSRDLLNP
ncbi:protein fam124a-like [Plakobranchus ocellatus]|uniref:Protein fam124a-like n=1 Tax=Plakobranchus ocellatus TaxID=259542 RepID=A0AAV3ZHG7_9GAST|nr:protein fam124a-like [Plakobranchus ocellatus]